jgi:DNA-binding LacI/PurR family transcriptional regulator
MVWTVSMLEESVRTVLDYARRLNVPVATLAVECIDFLHERGVQIPRRISVVGFDDSIEAQIHGLTSYNFNSIGVARGMLAHLLNPHPVDDFTEIPGTVVERRTSGAVVASLFVTRTRSRVAPGP